MHLILCLLCFKSKIMPFTYVRFSCCVELNFYPNFISRLVNSETAVIQYVTNSETLQSSYQHCINTHQVYTMYNFLSPSNFHAICKKNSPQSFICHTICNIFGHTPNVILYSTYIGHFYSLRPFITFLGHPTSFIPYV